MKTSSSCAPEGMSFFKLLLLMMFVSFTTQYTCSFFFSSTRRSPHADEDRIVLAKEDASASGGKHGHLHVVCFVTVPNQEVGRRIAKQLVSNSLAACVNILGSGGDGSSMVESVFRWKGNISGPERENLLMIKTKKHLVGKSGEGNSGSSRLESALRQWHPYEVFEFICLPIHAPWSSDAYLHWMDEELG